MESEVEYRNYFNMDKNFGFGYAVEEITRKGLTNETRNRRKGSEETSDRSVRWGSEGIIGFVLRCKRERITY